MAYEYETHRLLTNAPDYLSTLLSIDYLHCRVYNDPTVPALAYTMWDKDAKRWEVTFNPLCHELSDEAQAVLWRHEVGHIAFAHFGKEVCKPDDPIRSRAEQLEVGDIQINTYLIPDKAHMQALGKLNRKLIEQLTGEPLEEEGPGYIDPEVVLPEIGLRVQEYPYEIIHAYLHKKNDEEAEANGGSGNWTMDALKGMCGGVQGDVPEGSTAQASAAVIGQVTADGEEVLTGKQWGTDGSNAIIGLRDYDLPEWITPLEAFARAQVDVILADRRSHRRPAEIYQAAGIHVPTYRPSWTTKPETVVFLVDTSGSMSDQLKYVMPVIQYLKQNDIKVRLIAGDTHVTMDEEFTVSNPLPERVTGGGGTEITPLFERAMDYDPESLIAFTDGYVPRWPRDPGVPVLVVGCETDVPTWATKA